MFGQKTGLCVIVAIRDVGDYYHMQCCKYEMGVSVVDEKCLQ